jgi:hypothetical protein
MVKNIHSRVSDVEERKHFREKHDRIDELEDMNFQRMPLVFSKLLNTLFMRN